jgi:hypothetical protein
MKMRMDWRFAVVAASLMTVTAGAQVTPMMKAPYRLAAMPAEGLGAAGQSSNGNVKDELFTGTEVFEKNATNVTEITMDPDSLDMVGGKDKEKAHSMVLNVVRTYTYDKPGMYNMADVDAIRNKLNTGDWHCSVHVRNLKDGSGSDVCNKRRTDGLKESAIIEVQPKSLTFVHTIRRENGPGSSDLSGLPLPMIYGAGPMPLVAMMDPEAFAEMQIGLHGMPMIEMRMMKLQMEKQLKLNGPEMQKQFKELNSPEMRKRMEEMQKQMKELKLSPQMEEMKKRLDEMKPRAPEAPVAPAVPEMPKP